jgi:hypothetical protein
VKYTFAPPASHLRQDYLRRRFSHLDDALAPDGDTLSWVASQTEGFSFAFLKELCIAILLELANDATARLRSAAECHIESLRAQLSGAKPKDDEGEVKPSG